MDGVEPEQPPEDGQIAARQKMQAVLEAVESLPERERTVLKMRTTCHTNRYKNGQAFPT